MFQKAPQMKTVNLIFVTYTKLQIQTYEAKFIQTSKLWWKMYENAIILLLLYLKFMFVFIYAEVPDSLSSDNHGGAKI